MDEETVFRPGVNGRKGSRVTQELVWIQVKSCSKTWFKKSIAAEGGIIHGATKRWEASACVCRIFKLIADLPHLELIGQHGRDSVKGGRSGGGREDASSTRSQIHIPRSTIETITAGVRRQSCECPDFVRRTAERSSVKASRKLTLSVPFGGSVHESFR